MTFTELLGETGAVTHVGAALADDGLVRDAAEGELATSGTLGSGVRTSEYHSCYPVI